MIQGSRTSIAKLTMAAGSPLHKWSRGLAAATARVDTDHKGCKPCLDLRVDRSLDETVAAHERDCLTDQSIDRPAQECHAKLGPPQLVDVLALP